MFPCVPSFLQAVYINHSNIYTKTLPENGEIFSLSTREGNYRDCVSFSRSDLLFKVSSKIPMHSCRLLKPILPKGTVKKK